MVSPVLKVWLRVPWRTRIAAVLIAWVAAEALMLALVVKLVGVSGALLLGLGTSLLGASMVKRLGRSAIGSLRRGAGADGFSVLRSGQAVDGLLSGLGAVLLLLPGFLTDALGLGLAVPVVRRVVAGRLQGGARGPGGQPRAPHGPTQIDLEPGDWRADDEVRGRPMPKV